MSGLVGSVKGMQVLNALKSTNFRWLLAGSLLSSFARWGGTFVFGWLTLELTGSAAKTGIVLALRSAGYLLSPIAGLIADRYDRRYIMMSTGLLSILYALALAILLVTDSLQFWHLLIISSVSSLTQAFDNPIRKTIAADVVEPKYLTSSYALTTVATDTTAVIGPVMVATLATVMGMGGVAWAMVAVYSFNVFALGMMRLKTVSPSATKASPIKNLFEGGKYIWGHQAILALIVMAIIMNGMGAAQGVIMPLFAKNIFDVGKVGLGWLLSAGSLGGLIGALIVVVTGNHNQRAKITLVSTTVMGISLAMFSIAPSFGIALVLAGFTGMNSALFLTLGNALLLEYSDSKMRGRVMGVRGLCLGISLPVSLAVGFLSEALTPRSAGVMVGVTGVTLMVMVALFMPALLKLERKSSAVHDEAEQSTAAVAKSSS
ncbi:MAG: MFS transporter [Dehalococcoidia bacterium]|nr:MFS transporter [Dehalococcoidia bacterium]